MVSGTRRRECPYKHRDKFINGFWHGFNQCWTYCRGPFGRRTYLIYCPTHEVRVMVSSISKAIRKAKDPASWCGSCCNELWDYDDPQQELNFERHDRHDRDAVEYATNARFTFHSVLIERHHAT